MHEQRMKDAKDALEERMVRALERVPEVTIPAEFAARVAGRLPVRRAFAARPARYGLMTMRISVVVLVLALAAAAMHSGGRSVFGSVLGAELVALAMWMSGVRNFFVHET
jgi:Mg-chelatase subunit ChlI